jgi:phage terminase large subunit
MDPSRPDRINDYRRAGLNAVGADNSIPAGVARVAELLFRRKLEEGDDYARLYIHPRCVNTIREFKSYRRKRDPHNANAFLEDIEDRNNHALDSLRYMVIGEFGRSLSRRGLVSDA